MGLEGVLRDLERDRERKPKDAVRQITGRKKCSSISYSDKI
jgi:hypothetical protein